MSYSNYLLNQKINNLQNQINSGGGSQDLQSVLGYGNSAVNSIELTSATDDNILLEYNKLTFQKDINTSSIEYDGTTNALTINSDTLNLNGDVVLQQGLDLQNEDITNCYEMNCEYLNVNEVNTDVLFTNQASFNLPPHSVTPILGNDLTTKDYVDSLVGQYSGGYNLYLNYSETLVVNTITYNYLSNEVSSAVQQDVLTITDGTDQLIATFITDEINILEIPTGLWNMTLYGSVSGAGGILYYYFKIKKYSGGVITDLITSGNSPDVNATPTGNPDAYHMSATIDTPINVLLTDRIIIEIYCIKISGISITLNTYFESAYYSFIQTTLNAGTTLLTSSNNWTGNNNFALIPTSETATAGSNNTQLTTTAYIYNALSSYLTSATASSTYLTIANALSTYLTIANASATYLSITDAVSSYLTITNASSIYATITSLSAYALKASPTFTGILNCSSIIASSTVEAFSFNTTGVNFNVSNAGGITCTAFDTTGTATATTLAANTIDSAGTNITGGNVTVLGTPTTRNITIAGAQTQGSLSIATGPRSTVNSGTINFSNNSSSKNNIYFGNGGAGSATQTQTYIQGTCTFSNPITLPTATTTPITTQLGYFSSNTNNVPITVNNVSQAPASSTITNLPIGIYLFNFYAVSYTPSIGASQVMTYTITTTGNATSNIPQYVFSGIATTFQDSQRLSGIIKCTTAVNTIAMNFVITSGGGTIIASYFGYNYIKIA